MPRAKRICPKPGCPNPVRTRYCVEHERAADKARGSKADRGYGSGYQRQRAAIASKVNAGLTDCWRCSQPIQPGERWHMGHDDHDRSIIRGPEHAHCNLSAAGKASHR